MRFLPQARTSQPQTYTLPNQGQGNRALQALCLPFTHTNAANGARGTVSSNPPAREPGPYGVALKYVRAAGNQRTVYPIQGSTGGITVLWVGGLTGFGAYNQHAIALRTSSGGTERLTIGEASTTRHALSVTPSGGGTVTVADASGAAGDAVWLARVDPAGGVSLYKNGALIGTASAASANFSDVTVLEVGSTAFLADPGCKTYLATVWNRAITDAEASALSTNPWQVFAEHDTAPLVEVASGGGTTYNVSVAESVTLADADGSTAAFRSARAEALTFADAPVGAAVLGVARTESVSLSDAAAGAWSTPAALAEAISLADATDATTGPNVYDVAVDEALALADSSTGEFPFQAPQFSGADAWPRKRDTLREDVLDAIEALAPSKKIEREAKQAFKRAVDAPQAPSIGPALAQAIAGASERIQALVAQAITQAQAQQRRARRRKQQQQLLLM